MLNKNSYIFDLPTTKKHSIIKVMGIGGGGSNAVTNMYEKGIKDVSFIVCNTDKQALEKSSVPNKLALGTTLTQGLGAGANPEVGRNAAIESADEIKSLLDDGTKMVFLTAGLGGGTGSGSAPIIASIAEKLGILTVGIVTLPFTFEGRKKLERAHEALKQLKEHCDTVLVILNDKLKETYGNMTIENAFAQADDVLTTAAKSIAEIITVPGYVNVDFQDVKTVMKGAGASVMGSATAEGENRAIEAAEQALSSPLLDCKDIHGAQKLLLSIVSGSESELQMDELSLITDFIQDKVGVDAEVIFGHGSDDELGDKIRITVIATGFDESDQVNTFSYDFQNRIKKKYNIPKKASHASTTRNTFSDISSPYHNYSLESQKKKQDILSDKTQLDKHSEEYESLSQEDKMKIPAYIRKKIVLQKINAPEKNLKKYNLYEENCEKDPE